MCSPLVLVFLVCASVGQGLAQGDEWWRDGIWEPSDADADDDDDGTYTYNYDYDYDFSESSDSELTGSHVCSRQVFESGYAVQNVSYSCWEDLTLRCADNRCDGDRCRYSRRRKTCQAQEFRTCYRLEQRCVQGWVTKKYCCPGYEENGNGGCGVSIHCDNDKNGGCDQVCRSDGATGHHCECFDGYLLEGTTDCKDMDECQVNNGGCQHKCHNSRGSFFCSCKNGYRLENMTECKEIDECEHGNGGCEHNCVNTAGAFHCTCKRGYKLIAGFKCEDVDECKAYGANGGCEQECVNYQGGFRCACEEGLSLNSDNKTCTDVNGMTIPSDGGEVDFFGQEQPESAGALVGGIVAGALCLLGLLFLLLFIFIRRRRQATNDAEAIGTVSASVPVHNRNEYQSTNGFKPKVLPASYTNLGYNSKNSIIAARDGKVSAPPAKDEDFDEPPAYEDGYSMPVESDENIYDDVESPPFPRPPPYSERPQTSPNQPPKSPPPPAPTADQLKGHLNKLRKTGMKDDLEKSDK